MFSGKLSGFFNKYLFVFMISSIVVSFSVPARAAETGMPADYSAALEKCDELYRSGELDGCFDELRTLASRSKKNDTTGYVRALTYMMRVGYENGDVAGAEECRKEIDGVYYKVKSRDFLKNLYIARASIYANAGKFEQAEYNIKTSLKYSSDVETLLTYAMVLARFRKKDAAYVTLDQAFKKLQENEDTLEASIVRQMTAAMICLSFEDFVPARTYMDAVVANLGKCSDVGYFAFIYKSLLNNIFSFFEYHPFNIPYYERIYSMSLERGNNRVAGEMKAKTARILAAVGAAGPALEMLADASRLAGFDRVDITSEVTFDTLELMQKFAMVYIQCRDFKSASALLEKSVLIFEKKGNLKESFERIRALSYCKFRQGSPAWRPLMDELIKTCEDVHETGELLLTKNLLGEIFFETGEVASAKKIFGEVFEAIDGMRVDDFPPSGLAEIYFKSVYNMARVARAEKNNDRARKLLDKYIGLYDAFHSKSEDKKKRAAARTDSLKNFTVRMEFSVSELAVISGRLRFERAKMMKEAGDARAAYPEAIAALELIKSSDDYYNFYQDPLLPGIMNFILGFKEFSSKPEYLTIKDTLAQFGAIAEKYSKK